MPKVSICIPVYNVEKYIERCACSLFTQTLDDIEYIFVNDCSPDGSIRILERVMEEYPNRKQQIKIIQHDTNQGLPAARNSCLSVATGEYIAWCDSDDWVEPQMYEKMYEKGVAEKADIVYCGIYFEFPNRQIKCDYKEDAQPFQHLQVGIFFSSLCNKLIRRSLYTRHNISSYEGINMWEDLNVTIRLRYFSRKTVKVPYLFYHYNRDITDSISIPQATHLVQKMRCADIVEDFFRAQNKEDDFFLVIQLLKFQSKETLLLCPQLRDIKRWKTIHRESNKYIWKYKSIPFHLRIIYWLAAHGGSGIACFLIDLKQKIRRLIR